MNLVKKGRANNSPKLQAPLTILGVLFLSELAYCAEVVVYYGLTALL